MPYKNKICGIYKIINIINGKLIIGQSANIYKRWNAHIWRLNHNNHENLHFQNAWNKYGGENFKFEIILKCQEEKLNQKETILIKKYKSNNRKFGYNLTDGGGGIRGHKFSEEAKKKISIALTGKNHPNYGKHHSEETRRKISVSHTGKVYSKKYKQEMSRTKKGKLMGAENPFFGRHHSEKTKRKLREAHLGKNNFNYGKRHSKKYKDKMSRVIRAWWKARHQLAN